MRGSFLSPMLVLACLGSAPALAQKAVQDIAAQASAQGATQRIDRAEPEREIEVASGQLGRLEREWHRCVRQAFSGQPASLAKHAAQRAALADCKVAEDAYVAAALAAQDASEAGTSRKAGGLTGRARAWMSSVAASIVDPVAALIGGLTK